MKKTTILLFIISLTCFQLNAQNSTETTTNQKKNSVWFLDATIGGSNSEGGAALVGFSLNYQYNKNLFTFRSNISYELATPASLSIVFPFLTGSVYNIERALLYGRRHTYEGFSYSYSAGIAYSELKESEGFFNFEPINHLDNAIGFPLQFVIKWFKEEKSRYRIYEVIPVGKPTTLGNSIGFKFMANVSKIPYVGVGLTIGLGKHKKYN
ncbi:MAG: hypothetical protein MK202_14025 [Tenacibaculum sp.]|nr:hypothetical protein [Tenacibaculum sp.]